MELFGIPLAVLVVGIPLVLGIVYVYGQLFRAACWTSNWLVLRNAPADAPASEMVLAVTYQTTPAGPYTSPHTYELELGANGSPTASDLIEMPELVRALYVPLVGLVAFYAATVAVAGPLMGILVWWTQALPRDPPVWIIISGEAVGFVAAVGAVGHLLSVRFYRAFLVLGIFLIYITALYAAIAGLFFLLLWGASALFWVARDG